MRMERSQRSDFAYFYPLRVRWSEVDPQGIVFNPNYLMYAGLVMTEYMRALGCVRTLEDAAREQTDVFTVHAELNFYDSAKYDDELSIGARCTYLGRSSFRLLFGIFRGEELLTEVRGAYVFTDLRNRRPIPLPEKWVDAIVTHERTPPQRKV
jgi:acyl-CoA thioester hydrolase